MAWLGSMAGGTFITRFAIDAPELAPPRVAGEIFDDAALPPAAENQPSLLKTRVEVCSAVHWTSSKAT